MVCQVRWKFDSAVSCFHAVEVMLRGWPLADAGLKKALAGPVQALKAVMQVDHVEPTLLMEQLTPLAHGAEGNMELARVVLTKVAGREFAEHRYRRYADLFEALLAAWRQELPRLDERWPVNRAWLQEQWSQYGQDLLTGVAKWTEQQALAAEADLFLVHAVTGGGGTAHPRYRSVRIEAVNDNADANVPEVLRLAWLISCLHLTLPRYTDRFDTVQRCQAVGVRALIPVALMAAKECQLVKAAEANLESAVPMWIANPESNLAADLAQWWEVYGDKRPQWPLALAALDRVLASR